MVVLVRLPVAQVCLMPDYRAQRCKFDLTDEESSALRKSLTDAIEYDRYPLSPRVQMLRGILMKFGPMAPQPPPPARPPTPDARLGARADRDDLAILSLAKEIPAQSRGICVTSRACLERLFRVVVLDSQQLTIKKTHNRSHMAPCGRLRSSHFREGCRCDHLPRHTPRPRNPHRRRLL